MKRGKKYHGCGEKHNVEKRERGSNIIFPLILGLLRRISSREEGKGTEILWKKIEIKKMGVGKTIKLQGTLYTPEPGGVGTRNTPVRHFFTQDYL